MRTKLILVATVAITLPALGLVSGAHPIVWRQTGSSSANLAPDEIIRRAAANEEMLKGVERQYVYKQDVLVQTFGEARSVTAQLHRVSEITYDDLGNRVEKILEYPPSPLTTALGVAKPDFKSLLGVDPFFLTPQNVPRYTINFISKQKIDELNTYLFELAPRTTGDKPKKPKPGEEVFRPFQGRIWIDEQDVQVVKAEGRAVTAKDDRERFPKFEYYREYVGDKYWLPSMAYADDTLDFKRFDLPIRVTIKYTNYKAAQPRR
jgi:hypothetical protein